VKHNLKIICHGVSPQCICSELQFSFSVFPPFEESRASEQNTLRIDWHKKTCNNSVVERDIQRPA
ncbi:MAG: hypothetical protein VXZ69_00295, partial [Pseudomonadota bacterium]|nr:hypothetical protein [Pseudomonadota bacterium]